MYEAINSFPQPLSPVISTRALVSATRCDSVSSCTAAGLRPTKVANGATTAPAGLEDGVGTMVNSLLLQLDFSGTGRHMLYRALGHSAGRNCAIGQIAPNRG